MPECHAVLTLYSDLFFIILFGTKNATGKVQQINNV